MRRIGAILLSLLLLSGAGGCTRRLANQPAEKLPLVEMAVAVEKSLPQPVCSLLQEFCDNLYQLSGKTVLASLQYWEDITDSKADILFMPSERFFQIAPDMRVLQTDFIFTSYSHFTSAMNAPSTKKLLSQELSESGYSVYLAAYGGKRSLVSGNGSFVETLRSDDSKAIQELIEEMEEDASVFIGPADFSQPPGPDALYYADTLQLSALTEEQTKDYIIINLNYRYHFHLFCLSDQLGERLNKKQLAAVYEAAAALGPACDKAYQTMDTQGNRRFSSVILPSKKLQQIIFELQSSRPLPALRSPIYQHIQKYST
ncbi:MAG: hypothetical protein HFG27_05890 [Provencibacterium sp.]|jgi:hypothetical protein|nr:hypothetical protein [Provencibacterium sp.]